MWRKQYRKTAGKREATRTEKRLTKYKPRKVYTLSKKRVRRTETGGLLVLDRVSGASHTCGSLWAERVIP